MQEVKKCPFCGESPKVGFEYYSGKDYDRIFFSATVRCTCGTKKTVVFKATDIGDLVPLFDYENAIESAIDLWNERAE